MMKKCIPAVLVALSILTAGCFSSSDVELVKNGSFPGYPATTIGKILDSSFDKITWSSSQTAIGETVVRFDGYISSKLHEKMKTKLYNTLLMSVHSGVLTPSSGKEQLTQLYAAFEHLPQALSNYTGVDLYASLKEELPPMDDCRKLSVAMPQTAWKPDAIERIKGDLEKLRGKYAQTHSAYDKEELEREEKYWARIEVTFTTEWNTKAEECIKRFDSAIKNAINTHHWKTGTQVFLEWKILNDKSGFSLSQFGGDGLPRFSFNDFLKVITRD